MGTIAVLSNSQHLIQTTEDNTVYIIFNKERKKIWCMAEGWYGYTEGWLGGVVPLFPKFTPVTYTSKLAARVKAWSVAGVVVECKLKDIPTDEYLIGSYVDCCILDTHTGEVERTEGYLQVYLDRERYKLINWG